MIKLPNRPTKLENTLIKFYFDNNTSIDDY